MPLALAIYLQGLNHVLLQLLIFNTPGKESRVESRSEACCEQGKLAEQVFRRWAIFRSPFYEPNSSISSYLEKNENPSWWQLLLVTPRNLHDTSRKLLQKNRYMITYTLPSPKSHIFPCASLEQLLRAIWCAISWIAVLILPPKILTCNFRVGHCWKSAPWTYLFIHSHPIVSQLACNEIPMRVNPGHGMWEEMLLSCIVLALGNIPCEPPDFIPLLLSVVDSSTTDKLGVTCWWWKSYKTECACVPESVFECEKTRRFTWSRRPALCSSEKERQVSIMMKILTIYSLPL